MYVYIHTCSNYFSCLCVYVYEDYVNFNLEKNVKGTDFESFLLLKGIIIISTTLSSSQPRHFYKRLQIDDISCLHLQSPTARSGSLMAQLGVRIWL